MRRKKHGLEFPVYPRFHTADVAFNSGSNTEYSSARRGSQLPVRGLLVIITVCPPSVIATLFYLLTSGSNDRGHMTGIMLESAD